MKSIAFLKSMSISCSPLSPSRNCLAKRHKMVTIGTILILAIISGSLLSPQAIIPTKPKTIEELSRLADVIIKGSVVSQKGEAGMTFVTLKIEKTLKGEAELGCQEWISITVRGSEEVPVEKMLSDLGIFYRINGKTNTGLGRPKFKGGN